MRRFKMMLAVCSVFLAFSITSALASDLLDVIPDDVLGFAAANNPAEVSGKIEKLAKTLQLPIPGDPLKLAKAEIGIQAGFDDQGTVGMALFGFGGGQPDMVAFLPTTDYAKLAKSLNAKDTSGAITEIEWANKGKAWIGRKGDYLVMAPPYGRATLEKTIASKTNIGAKLKPMRKWLGKQDAYLVVTKSGIQMALDQAIAGLKAVQELGDLGEGPPNPGLKVLDSFTAMLATLKSEITNVAIAANLDDQSALRISSLTLFNPGGQYAKAGASVRPVQGGPLTGLPDEPFVFAGGGPISAELVAPMMEFSMSMIKSMPGGDKISEKQMKELIDVSNESMKGVRSMSMMMGVAKPDESIYSGMVIRMQVDDSAKYLADYGQALKKMAALSKEIESPFFPKSEVKPFSLDGHQGLEVVTKIADISGVPGAEGVIEKLLGGKDKLSVYIIAADKNTVLMSYVTKDRLQKMLAARKGSGKSLKDNPKVAATAKLLPGGSQWVGYVSPKGVFDTAMGFMAIILPEARAEIPKFPDTQPVATAARLSKRGLRTDLVVPVDVMKGIADYVRLMQTKGLRDFDRGPEEKESDSTSSGAKPDFKK